MKCCLIFALILLLLRGSNGDLGSSPADLTRFIRCLTDRMKNSNLFPQDDVEIMDGVVAFIKSKRKLTQMFLKNVVIRPMVMAMIGTEDVHLYDRKKEFVSNMEQCSITITGAIDKGFLDKVMDEHLIVERNTYGISQIPIFQISFKIPGENSQLQELSISQAVVQPPPVQPVEVPANAIGATSPLSGLAVPSFLRGSDTVTDSSSPGIEPSLGGASDLRLYEQNNGFISSSDNSLLSSQSPSIFPSGYPGFQQQVQVVPVVQPGPQSTFQQAVAPAGTVEAILPLVPNPDQSFGGTLESRPGEQNNGFIPSSDNTLLSPQSSSTIPSGYPGFQQQVQVPNIVQPWPQSTLQQAIVPAGTVEAIPPSIDILIPNVEPLLVGIVSSEPIVQNNGFKSSNDNTFSSSQLLSVLPFDYFALQQISPAQAAVQALPVQEVAAPTSAKEVSLVPSEIAASSSISDRRVANYTLPQGLEPSLDGIMASGLGVEQRDFLIPPVDSKLISTQSSPTLRTGNFKLKQQPQISTVVQPLPIQPEQSATITVGTTYPSDTNTASVSSAGTNGRTFITDQPILGKKLPPTPADKFKSLLKRASSLKNQQRFGVQVPLQCSSPKPKQSSDVQVPLQISPLKLIPGLFESTLADHLSRSSEISRLYCAGEPMKNVAQLTLRTIYLALKDLGVPSKSNFANVIAKSLLEVPLETLCSNYSTILSKLIAENLQARGILNVAAAAMVDKISLNFRNIVEPPVSQEAPQLPIAKSEKSEVPPAQTSNNFITVNDPVRYAEMQEEAKYYQDSIKTILEIIKNTRYLMRSKDGNFSKLCSILNEISPIIDIPRFQTCSGRAAINHLLRVLEIVLAAYDGMLVSIF